jgi:transcription elongation factor Elf1
MKDVIRSILQRVTAFWNRLFRPHTEEPVPAVEISRDPGLRCPECGTLIRVTIADLLHVGAVACTQCHLVLEIDHERSKGAIDALARLENAHDEARRITRSA